MNLGRYYRMVRLKLHAEGGSRNYWNTTVRPHSRPPAVDPAFLALPFERLADAALTSAKAAGATHVDFRFERLRRQMLVVRDRELLNSVSDESMGFSVRVIYKGAWGFAAGIDLTPEAAIAVARRAIEVAETLAPLAPQGTIVVAESGLKTTADLERLEAAGVRAFLIGETFMRAPDPGAALRELLA